MSSQNSLFSFIELNNLFNNGPLKNYQDAKNYISRYFYPLINGTHALVENNEITIIQDETLRKVYLARFPKQIKKFYLEETIPKNIICDVKQPIITEQSINVCKRFKHEYQEYKTFDKKTKSSVELFLTYIYIKEKLNIEDIENCLSCEIDFKDKINSISSTQLLSLLTLSNFTIRTLKEVNF